MNWAQLMCTTRAESPERARLNTDRTEFEEDLQRVVFSTPVRRLQDKTHVFPLEKHDSVRTRLTHSLEVSSVARDLSQAVCRRMSGQIPPEFAPSIATTAAACALLHDVGNPPFGHAGEKAIQDWFRRKLTQFPEEPWMQDFLQFDGNAQMMRLAGRLQVLSRANGLNLTFGTLSAACKYVVAAVDTDTSAHDRSKPGFFETERELITRVQQETGTGVARHPVTYLVEAADDIVNVSIDLEDGVRKRLFRWQEMIDEIEYCGGSGDALILRRDAEAEIGRTGLGSSGVGDTLAQAFRTNLMARLIPAAIDEFQRSYPAIMTGDYGHELVKRSGLGHLYSACKEVVKRHVYSSPEVLRLEIMGRRVIHDLLDLYWEGVTQARKEDKGFGGKLYAILSDNYRSAFEQDLQRSFPGLDPASRKLYLQLRLVCDQVAGMTDAYAVSQHRLLTNA